MANRGLPESRDILHLKLAEDLAASLEFPVHALQHAEAELAVTFDGDDAGMRQMMRGVRLEFDAFLEVDEIELDLIGTGPHREIRDHRMDKR